MRPDSDLRPDLVRLSTPARAEARLARPEGVPAAVTDPGHGQPTRLSQPGGVPLRAVRLRRGGACSPDRRARLRQSRDRAESVSAGVGARGAGGGLGATAYGSARGRRVAARRWLVVATRAGYSVRDRGPWRDDLRTRETIARGTGELRSRNDIGARAGPAALARRRRHLEPALPALSRELARITSAQRLAHPRQHPAARACLHSGSDSRRTGPRDHRPAGMHPRGQAGGARTQSRGGHPSPAAGARLLDAGKVAPRPRGVHPTGVLPRGRSVVTAAAVGLGFAGV